MHQHSNAPGPLSYLAALVAIAVPLGPAAAAEPAVCRSPDGRLKIEFTIADEGVPTFGVERDGRALIVPSRLGLDPDWLAGFELVDVAADSHDSQWENPLGERRIVPDRYNEIACDLRHASGRLLRVTFRAYDEGISLRYTLPVDAEPLAASGERTEFRFPAGTQGYEEHGTEGPYELVPIADFRPYCERPVTLELPDGSFAALTEAANFSYARTLFSPTADEPAGLVTALGGNTSNTANPNQRHDPRVTLAPGASTPWRALIVGDRPGDLLERNYLVLNLAPPCALADASWIKPGKVMRETTLTTANAKAVIDFAPVAGLCYVHFDARWYGSEDARTGDATTVRVPDLDIEEVVRYGREHGIGVIVYVDRRQIRRQRDELFAQYEAWGLAGVKIGFIDVGPQAESVWTTETIRAAADHRLMLNIHDGYRATGVNRTYPNLMTVEGIRGNEHMPTAEHNCTLPFTRYVAGIGDYTVCYYSNRIQTTHAHQLAMHVVSFSPLQWIFWYDKPDMYRGEPEIEFFREAPTVWDETRVLHGEIGKFATIARRSGEGWFVGTINGGDARTLSIPLEFLPPDRQYVASVYEDDPAAATRTRVSMRRLEVDSAASIEAKLTAAGGQAIWLRPATRE